jgi:hypothetical protein
MPQKERRQQAYAELVADLRAVATAIDSVDNHAGTS